MTSRVQENTSPYRAFTPPLESGDVLDAQEYWQRYSAASEKVKAERINRKVYLMSPLLAVHHGNPHLLLAQWIATYAMHNPGLVGSDNATIRLNKDNDIQPHGCIYKSVLFPGLWLDAEALRSANAIKLIATLQQGMGT